MPPWTRSGSQGRGKVAQLALVAAAGSKCTSLPPSPVPRALPRCSWSNRSHTGGGSSRERLWEDAASEGCQCTRLELLVPLQSSQVCCPFPFTFPPLLWPDMRLVHWDRRNLRGFFPVLDLTHRVCSSMEAKGHSRFTGSGRCRFSVELWQESCFCQSALQPANGREQPWDSRFFLTHTVVNESLCSFQHYEISYIRKNKLIITSFKIDNKYKKDNF